MRKLSSHIQRTALCNYQQKGETTGHLQELESKAMSINKIYDTMAEYMDKSLSVNGEARKKAEEALKELKEHCWRPVVEGEFPKNEEIVLVSFENSPVPAVLTYREDPEGGAFYDDTDADSNPVSHYGLIASAWRPLDRYEEERK